MTEQLFRPGLVWRSAPGGPILKARRHGGTSNLPERAAALPRASPPRLRTGQHLAPARAPLPGEPGTGRSLGPAPTRRTIARAGDAPSPRDLPRVNAPSPQARARREHALPLPRVPRRDGARGGACARGRGQPPAAVLHA